MHNTVSLQMSHSVVCVCYIVAVKAASLSSFVMPLSEEMCACVESGFRAAWGCSSLFFVCSSSPSLPPSLPPSGSGSMHSTLSHTLPQLQESTHTFFTIYPEPAWVKTACASVSCEDGKESVCDPD